MKSVISVTSSFYKIEFLTYLVLIYMNSENMFSQYHLFHFQSPFQGNGKLVFFDRRSFKRLHEVSFENTVRRRSTLLVRLTTLMGVFIWSQKQGFFYGCQIARRRNDAFIKISPPQYFIMCRVIDVFCDASNACRLSQLQSIFHVAVVSLGVLYR